ncbi:MAG: DMT family transporter [Dialister sp.]|nr:DMT family transporter [Dialister sp.]
MSSMRMRGILMATVGCILWGTSGIAGQFLLVGKQIPPEWLTLCRLLLGGMILLMVSLLKEPQRVFAIWRDGRDGRELFFFGALGMLFTQYAYFVSIKYSNAATATVLEYLMPILILGWYGLKQRRPLTRKEIFCAVFAMAGTFLIATQGELTRLAISPKALIWGLIAAASCAFYTVEPKRIIQKWGAVLVVGWGMIVAGIVLIPLACLTPVTGDLGMEAVGAFIYVVLFGTVLSFSLYLGSLAYIDPSETSIIAALEPLSSIVFSCLVFHMFFGMAELLGMLLIIAAVGVVTSK